MKVLKRWFGRKGSDVIDSPEKLATALGVSYSTFAGQSISPTRAMQVATVFGCVRVLSESVGMLPCKLFERQGRYVRLATDHSLYRLLTIAPNGFMTAQEFWELLVACLCLRGNFYAYKVVVMGQVKELLPLNPGSVTPKLLDDWTVVYEVVFKDGSRDVLTQDQIWHVRLFTLDGVTGLNPVAYARQAIGLALATEEHGARLFSNGAVTTGVLQTAQRLTTEAYNRLKEDFEQRHQGVANAHRPMILEMGLEWKPISLSAEDSQFLETRKYQRDEICAIFRVPPHLVANLEKATFSNIEHLGLSFVNYSLVPLFTRIEHRIEVGLLPEKEQGRIYAKFNAGALLRGDLKTRYEAYGKGIQWGFLSPNEARELEDMNPRDGGDIYLTPLNMTTDPELGNDNA